MPACESAPPHNACRAPLAALLALAVVPHALGAQIIGPIATPATAPAPGQPPSNYHGPTLFGVCVYVVGDTSFYSNVFSTSGYFKFKAQEAFQQYAVSRTSGATLRGSGCRWSTSQDEVTTQKDADKRLLGLPGRSAKGVETGWVYNAAASAATTPATTASRSAATSNSARVAGTAAKSSNSSNAAVASGGSITDSTQQTVQSSLATSKASATGAVNDTVATTMGTVSTGAGNAIKGLFNHKGKTAASDAAPPNSTATGQNPTPLGLTSTESPQVATAEAQKIQGLVADVAGSDIIINVGTQAGVHPGSKLAIMHATRVVKDPSTGKVLRTVEDKVGDLTIRNADDTSAAGTFAGTGTAKVGDTVRSEPN